MNVLSEYDLKDKVTKNLVLAYDKLFLDYTKNIIEQNSFKKLTYDGLIDAIKTDPDTNNQFVLSFLRQLR